MVPVFANPDHVALLDFHHRQNNFAKYGANDENRTGFLVGLKVGFLGLHIH